MRLLFIFLLLGSLVSCNKGYKRINAPEPNTSQSSISNGQKLLNKSLLAHGGKKYDTAHYSFTFRDKQYTFKNNGAEYFYQSSSQKDGVERIDILENNDFTRTENGETINLSDKEKTRFGNSLNSVIYFATLPHKLQDKAVNKKYIGTKTIKGKTYEILEITFNEEGGGDDHDDMYYYWINSENDLIEYLAYNYKVNKGGVRFRTAYNLRNVDGIIFQDYVNYKAEVGTPLGDLPQLWEAGKLKELSKIETEQVVKM